MNYKLIKIIFGSLVAIGVSSQQAKAFTIIEGPLIERNINGDTILDPFVFSFTELPEVAATETELFLRLDYIDLDLDDSSEFFTASIENNAGIFDLGQFPNTITSAGFPTEQANVDGFGELSILLNNIGNFKGGDLTFTLNPNAGVNPILPGNPSGPPCFLSDCGGRATITLSYTESTQAVPESQTLSIFGAIITLGFGTFIRKKQIKYN